ncbi:hypothetical protein ACG2F4_10160 [Halalkalibaculum sp. DA3122]|uniref:hypothetical protein n=1 Tax=Halalkalibaculum sp. DA3122 TaxID=3373607 RepID=UPI003754950E
MKITLGFWEEIVSPVVEKDLQVTKLAENNKPNSIKDKTRIFLKVINTIPLL